MTRAPRKLTSPDLHPLRRERPPRLSLFDCFLGVGETGAPGRPVITRPAQLLRELDHLGIQEALVYDIQEVEIGRFEHTDFIRGFCAGSPRLHPSVALTPPEAGEIPPPKPWVGRLLEQGIKAVRAWPQWHNFDFLPYCLGPLLQVLQEHRIPVFVSYFSTEPAAFPWGHTPQWDHIQRTAEAFPSLPIIVTHTGMLQNRRLIPLLHRCPNVRCDITCSAAGFPEFIRETLSADRLLFTCEYPLYDPGLLLPWIRYADIDEPDARKIAGDNLRRLLQEVR